jgi:hypothetical protein
MLTRKCTSLVASILFTILFSCETCAAQKARYFKAEHGVAATYVELAPDDREHMGVSLTDEGRWQQTRTVITFSPKDPKKTSYQATENTYRGRVFLAITTANADAGIVITADDTRKALDADPNYLPDHVLFKITVKTYSTETKQTYPFHFSGKEK